MRALRMAFKYKVSLIGSMVCCVLVAALWGANISALYPFVEVVFKGESLHEWVDDRVASAEEIIEKNEKTIADLELEKEGASPSEARSIDARISRLASANDGESRKGTPRFGPRPTSKNICQATHSKHCCGLSSCS